MLSFIINWDSESSIERWTIVFDYAGSLDFLIALVLLYILLKKVDEPKERNWQICAGVLALIAGCAWVVDTKLNHRLTFLQQQIAADRHITDVQRAKFVNFLAPVPKRAVAVDTYFTSGPEAATFAGQIRKLMNEAGCATEHPSMDVGLLFVEGPPPKGIVLIINNSTNRPVFAHAIREAFTSIGIETGGLIDPTAVPDENGVMIAVGPKP